MTTDQTTTGTATDDVTTLRTGYAAFAAGDVPVVLGMMHADVEWTDAAGGPYGGTYRGQDAVVEGVFAKIGSEWSEFRVEPEEFIASGGAVAVLGTYRGTYAATGTSMESRFVHVWHFREGRAARFEQVADTATMNAALS
jgi:uncharacterized protein